jgi:hypothetical protein
MQQLGFDKGLDECCVEQVLRIGVASLAAAGFGWNFFYHDLQRDAVSRSRGEVNRPIALRVCQPSTLRKQHRGGFRFRSPDQFPFASR